jgi:hypothetical protein
MAIPNVITSQTGGRQYNAPDMTKYSMFVGGVNATHHALRNYSPMLNGFGRLFMVRVPHIIAHMFAGNPAYLYSKDNLFIQFKHMLEYMNRSVTGFQEKTLEVAQTPIQGGFAGRQFNTPTVTKETTSEITIGLYEMVGAPVLTVIDGWMNAIGDENSGLATYGGWISGGTDANGFHKRLYKRSSEDDRGFEFNEAEHTAEFIYVMHDRSGAQVERAVLLADCFPKGIAQQNVLDMAAGAVHDNVTYDITFNCIVYRSPIITAIANDLLKQYRIVSNSLNFNPELGDSVYGPNNVELFQKSLGSIPVDSATGTNIGNVPAFYFHNDPKTVLTPEKDINHGRLSGQGTYAITENWDGFSGDLDSQTTPAPLPSASGISTP